MYDENLWLLSNLSLKSFSYTPSFLITKTTLHYTIPNVVQWFKLEPSNLCLSYLALLWGQGKVTLPSYVRQLNVTSSSHSYQKFT